MEKYADQGRRWLAALRRRALLIALAACLLLAGLPLGAEAAPEPPHILRPDPVPDRDYQVTFRVGPGVESGLQQGRALTLPVTVSVSGAIGLASATVLVKYDAADLRVTGCAHYADAPSGYCNASYDPANGLVRFNLLAEDGILEDNVGLFELTVETAGTSIVDHVSQVTPLIESLADTQGQSMTAHTLGTPVRVLSPSGAGPAVYVGAPGGPNPISITRATTVTVPLVVTGALNLGSASFALPYSASVVRAVDCRVLHPTGSELSSFCAVHDDRVEASLLSQEGFTGSATLFEVVFTTAAGGRPGQSSNLNLRIETFADTAGAHIPVRVVNNSLRVSNTSGGSTPVLSLEPQSQSLAGDARVTLHLVLDNGARLAAGTWTIKYDAGIVLAESCTLSSDIAGALQGACSVGAPGSVRMTVVAAGETLPRELATISFRRHPAAHANAVATVSIDVTNFDDLSGQPLDFQTTNSTISIKGEVDGPPAVTLRLGSEASYLLPIGGSLELPINLTIDAAQPLGTLAASIYYDPAVVRPTRCVRPTGSDFMGYCNIYYDRTRAAIRFNLLSTEGLSGAVVPFRLTLEPASGVAVGRNHTLAVRLTTVSGPLGEPRTWSTSDPGITIAQPVAAAKVKIGDPIDDGQYALEIGKPLMVPVAIVDVEDLGAATILVKYDSKVVRAAGCAVRTDLIGAGGGFCSIVPTAVTTGTVAATFIIPNGFTGSGRFFEMSFVDAPNADTGMATPLLVQVQNFVSTAGLPIPTTWGNGAIQIPCKLPAPVLSIALQTGDDVRLSWPHITQDVCGLPVTVTEYQIWRDRAPYDSTAAEPYAIVPPPAGATASTIVSTTDTGTRFVAGGFFYRVVAVATLRPPSDYSNLKGKFTYPLIPGTP